MIATRFGGNDMLTNWHGRGNHGLSPILYQDTTIFMERAVIPSLGAPRHGVATTARATTMSMDTTVARMTQGLDYIL